MKYIWEPILSSKREFNSSAHVSPFHRSLPMPLRIRCASPDGNRSPSSILWTKHRYSSVLNLNKMWYDPACCYNSKYVAHEREKKFIFIFSEANDDDDDDIRGGSLRHLHYCIVNIELLLSAATVQYICVYIWVGTLRGTVIVVLRVTSTLLHSFSTETTEFFLIKRN